MSFESMLHVLHGNKVIFIVIVIVIANHPHKFQTKGAFTKELKNFFTHRSIPEWTNLPASLVEASTPETFKVRLAGLGTWGLSH